MMAKIILTCHPAELYNILYDVYFGKSSSQLIINDKDIGSIGNGRVIDVAFLEIIIPILKDSMASNSNPSNSVFELASDDVTLLTMITMML